MPTERDRHFPQQKENHGFRFFQMIGKARMEMKTGLTFLHESEKTGKDDSQEGKNWSPKVFIIDQVHTFCHDRKKEKRFLEC